MPGVSSSFNPTWIDSDFGIFLCASMAPINARSTNALLPRSTRCFSSAPPSFAWVQKLIKVQLRTDHPVHGKAGQVIHVKPGYMRQHLYPTRQALYCAKDGIPFHHFQPSTAPDTKVPPPGLSRPVGELLERLGTKMEITEEELQAAQAQIDRWKQSANEPARPLADGGPSSEPRPAGSLPAPGGLEAHLEHLALTLDAHRRPLLVLKSPGPDNSHTLYSSIKADELLHKIILQLHFSDPSSDSPLADHLQIVGASDPLPSPLLSESSPDLTLLNTPVSKFKPIKSVGSYLIAISLSSASSKPPSSRPPQNSAQESPEKCYKFLIQIEK